MTANRGITVSGGQSQLQFAVDYRSVTSPLSQADLLSQKFVIRQPSFFSPFIVPALDQLGLATITIPFRILDVVSATSGALWAYGFESYNAGGAGAPIRNLLYTFTGTYQNGNLILASAPSYFELTSLPTPLTTMKVTGTTGSGDGGKRRVLARLACRVGGESRGHRRVRAAGVTRWSAHWHEATLPPTRSRPPHTARAAPT